MNLRDLVLRIRALAAPRRVERELDDELAFHIERETQKHIAAGLSPADARTRALACFGPVALAADECRDARGTGVVDDLTRDILYAFRTFRRAPLAALTIVATVAVGLGLVAAVFSVFSVFFLRVDAVRKPDELFGVWQEWTGPNGARDVVAFTRPTYETLRRDTRVFTDSFAFQFPEPKRTDGGRVLAPMFVTGNFFQILGVQAAFGRALMPGDDVPAAGRATIVLSHAGSRKLFRDDRMVIGRRIVVGGVPHEIVGVMPRDFRGLHLTPPDYWAPLALADARSDVQVGGRLRPGMTREAATAALTVWEARRTDVTTPDGRPMTVALETLKGTVPGEDLEFALAFLPLFLVFGLILLVGCANVANLLLARGVSRHREIGVRLSLGASRWRIIRQLLTESLLLALAAGACGVVVSRVLMQGTLSAAMAALPPELALMADLMNLAVPPPDWRLMAFMGAGAVVSTVFFGLAPALRTTRLDLVQAMRTEGIRHARRGFARHALIAVQVGVSALLLISAAVFLRGTYTAARKVPAIRTSDTVRVSVGESPRPALRQAVTTHPLVAAAAASSLPGRAIVETPVRLPVDQLAVSSDYFDILGIDIVRGRIFTRDERNADAGVVMVSESIARQLWPGGDAVGQPLRLQSSPTEPGAPPAVPRSFSVVGVVRDMGGSGVSSLETFRGVYLPTSLDSPEQWLMLRVRGNPEQVRQTLMTDLSDVDPELGGVVTLRTLMGLGTYMLGIASSVTVLLGGLALLLTVSGLFSVLSYVIEQQTRDIGVRMALGAAATNVVRLVLSQSLRPVGLGLAAGAGLAAALETVLMSLPNAAEVRGWLPVFDPVAYGASLLVIVMCCLLAVSAPALRATRIDPIAALRKD